MFSVSICTCVCMLYFIYTCSAVPTVLEYMSYCFNFHSVLAGPAVTMREHLTFMDGSNFQVAQNSSNNKDNDIRVRTAAAKGDCVHCNLAFRPPWPTCMCIPYIYCVYMHVLLKGLGTN